MECDREKKGESSGSFNYLFIWLCSLRKLIMVDLQLILASDSLPCSSSLITPVKLNFSPNPNHKYGHISNSELLEIWIQNTVLYARKDKNLDLNALKYYCSTCAYIHIASAGACLHWKCNYYPGNKGRTISFKILTKWQLNSLNCSLNACGICLEETL